MSVKAKLFLLALAVITIGVGGYLLLERELDELANSGWHRAMVFLKTFSITVVIGMIVVMIGWLPSQIAKRVFFAVAVPQIVTIVMPAQQHRRLRRWLERRRLSLLVTRMRVLWWLKHEKMFGSHAGLALSVIAAGIFFIAFYVLFSIYLVLWLGFIKIPAIITGYFWFIGSRLFFAIERAPVSVVIIKWIYRGSVWIDRYVLTFRKFLDWTPEEHRRTARRRMRRAIKLRRNLQLLLRVGYKDYRLIVAERNRRRLIRHAASHIMKGN